MTFIVATVYDVGVLKTGLTPHITIYDLSNVDPTTEVITAEDMTEIGNGMYIYKFAADSIKKYAVYADFDPTGADGLAVGDRYETTLLEPSFGYMTSL